jgi:hypothetical protein
VLVLPHVNEALFKTYVPVRIANAEVREVNVVRREVPSEYVNPRPKLVTFAIKTKYQVNFDLWLGLEHIPNKHQSRQDRSISS